MNMHHSLSRFELTLYAKELFAHPNLSKLLADPRVVPHAKAITDDATQALARYDDVVNYIDIFRDLREDAEIDPEFAELIRACEREVRTMVNGLRSNAGIRGETDKVGYSRSEMFRYRIAYTSVLSTNGENIVLPGENLGRDGIDHRSVSYARLPDNAVVNLRLKNLVTDVPAVWLKSWKETGGKDGVVHFRVSRNGRTVVVPLSIDAEFFSVVREDNEKARPAVNALIDLFGRDYFVLAGGPLSSGKPVTVMLLGTLAYNPGTRYEAMDPELDIEDETRFLKVSPLAMEVRRQIMDVERDLQDVHPGWLGVGTSKHDVPKDACYVARWKDCGVERYVWVCPAFRKEFEDFTIKVLNFSGLVKNVQVQGASGVKYSPGTSGGFFGH